MIKNHNTLAIVFPGQSSQHVGMLSNLSNNYKLVRETFSEASEVLGYDLWKLTQFGPTDKLNRTCQAQPAILTASVAIWKIWKSQGGQIPNIMAGHSLGEYSALVCSGSIDLLSAVKLVLKRSILMQKSAPYGYGAMSVIIGLDNDIVVELCKIVETECNQIVAPAGFNSLKNIVISGYKEAVNQVNILCKNAGATYVSVLPISVPSHCSIMKSMINEFQEELEKIIIYPPKIPIINNTNVSIETEPLAIRDALVRQLYTPVRWNEIIQKFNIMNITKILEMGPGKVLTKLIKRTFSDNVYSESINDSRSLLKSIQMYIN